MNFRCLWKYLLWFLYKNWIHSVDLLVLLYMHVMSAARTLVEIYLVSGVCDKYTVRFTALFLCDIGSILIKYVKFLVSERGSKYK
jgi:hypothetical protein